MTARKVPKNQVPSELVDNQDNVTVSQSDSDVTVRQIMLYPGESYDGDDAINVDGYFDSGGIFCVLDINTGEESAVGTTIDVEKDGSTYYLVTVDETRAANYRSLYGVGDGHLLIPIRMSGSEDVYDVTITSGGKTASLTLTYVPGEP